MSWFLCFLLLILPRIVSAENADFILIEKANRRLVLYSNQKELARYSVALGREPSGPMRCQGDNKTPEGNYVINSRKSDSKFYRSLKISYPNESDRRNAASLGCDPGGDIMIHGLPRWRGWLGIVHRFVDWTRGCIAVNNSEIDEIWKMAPNGTHVRIVP